jgi:hypothetical protein
MPNPSRSTGLFPRPSTQFITQLQEEMEHAAAGSQFGRFLSDQWSTFSKRAHDFSTGGEIHMGYVVEAMPYVNWYRVQLDRGLPVMGACMLSESGFVPCGITSTSPIPPRSKVLAYKPKYCSYAIILGAWPEVIADGSVNIGTWLQQGTDVGLKRDDARLRPLQAFFRGGGIRDFSCHRPVDGTSMEWGKTSATGIALLIDNFQAFLRVNEACGLFLNFFDSFARLAGMNMDLQSFPWGLTLREDEGECQLTEEGFIYPWESLGVYAPSAWSNTFTDQEVHYTKMKGKVDLADGDEDLMAFARWQEYGGYLGQGHLRSLVTNSKASGKRHYGDTDHDLGLFQESVALDGSWTVTSAKQNALVKRVIIPAWRRQRLPEDQKTGDDSRKGNYKFSGWFGSAEDHKVGDIDVTAGGDNDHLLRSAGVLDLLTYAGNWKNSHPFYYHKLDFSTPDESKITEISTAQDNLDFSVLGGQEYMPSPHATTLWVDHRYGAVKYYCRESFIVQHEDGSIQLGDGYGNQIVMGPNGILIDTPGDVQLRAGRRLLSLSGQAVVRAKGSVDVSSSAGDVHIKAEGNFQAVSNTKGILLESKASGAAQDYGQKFGEDVQSTGIVLLAQNSQIGAIGQSVLVRSGPSGTGGSITLDAAQGGQPVNIYGANINLFAAQDVNIWNGPSGADGGSAVAASHCFSSGNSKIDGQLIVEDNLVVTGGDVFVNGDIHAENSITAVGALYQQGGGEASPTPPSEESLIKQVVGLGAQFQSDHIASGAIYFQSQIAQPWYAVDTLGNATFLTQVGFSFRDPLDSTSQYKTSQYQMLESRWQQMVRLGAGNGGESWSENPVVNQGRPTYPFPGQAKLQDQSFLQLAKHTMYDDAAGRAQDRPAPYEAPALAAFTPAAIDGTYTVISS